MYFIYSLLYSIALLFLLPLEYAKRPRQLRARWVRERLGLFKPDPAAHNSKTIWIHAVSVGEVLSSIPFIRELKGRNPSLRIILSTVTDTGQKVACERVSDIVRAVYLPFDAMFILRGLLKRIRPDVFIAIETELWPNIFRLFKREGIPILILNGRLSEKSFRGYRKIRFFIGNVLRCVDTFGMQDDTYAKRIKELGADDGKVKVIGNFKFDIKPPEQLPAWSALLKGPVIVAGSTHEGEEKLVLSVFERLRNDFPEANLIVAPRHPERFRRVEELIRERGLPLVKRSEIAHGSSLIVHGKKDNSSSYGLSAMSYQPSGVVLLLDTIGELASAYGVADVAVIGGSFEGHGGHNPLEPAFWGKPVVCGPHMENFPFVQDFYREGGAIECDAEALYDVLKELIYSPEKRNVMGGKAKDSYTRNSGAVKRALEMLERYVELDFPVAEEKPLP